MSERGRQFFDEWVRSKLYGFNPRYLQNPTSDNERYLVAEAKQSGIERFEIESEVGGDLYRAVFDAMMEALKPSTSRA